MGSEESNRHRRHLALADQRPSSSTAPAVTNGASSSSGAGSPSPTHSVTTANKRQLALVEQKPSSLSTTTPAVTNAGSSSSGAGSPSPTRSVTTASRRQLALVEQKPSLSSPAVAVTNAASSSSGAGSPSPTRSVTTANRRQLALVEQKPSSAAEAAVTNGTSSSGSVAMTVTDRRLVLVEKKPVAVPSSGGGSPSTTSSGTAAGRGARPAQALVERLKDYGQEDVFAYWDETSAEERDLLVREIQGLDLPRVDRIIRRSLKSHGLALPTFEPVSENTVSTIEERTPAEKERWLKAGLKAISEGKLAVLLLAGGQGTRLGSSDPKGCFSIGLPSRKSLFQLQAERILRIQRLASQSVEGGSGCVPIHWYIMTSPFTDSTTRKFFESRKYFGMEADQVTFFQQGSLPCVSKDGRFIMETASKVAKAPDGNGGVYSALKSFALLEDMGARGVKYVDCYGVDNALVRVADPTFLGYFIEKGVPAASKVVRKAYPQEKVGVFVRRGKGGPLSVLEYSDMDPSTACEINQITGRLRYCWSNVCLHLFTLDFLNQVVNGLEKDSVYHLAEKTIQSIHGPITGFKLEQFVFDAFSYASSTALFESIREEEFAPVKNASGATYDTPETARQLLLRLHTRWVVAAGGFVTHSVPLYATGVEVSPLCSYAGENLEPLCRGRTFHAPGEITYLYTRGNGRRQL